MSDDPKAQVVAREPELPHMLRELIRFLHARQRAGDPIVKAVLRHVAPSGVITPLADYSGSEIENLELLGRRAWEEAAIYASNYRGPAQAFALRVYRVSDPSEAVAQFRWVCEGDQGDDGMIVPPQVGGAEAASMLARHLEATQRTMLQMITDNNRRHHDERIELRKRITDLEGERVRYWRVWEEAQTTQGEREIARLEADGRERRKDQAAQTLRLLAPLAASAIAKKAGIEIAAPDDPELESMKQLFASLQPDQFAAFVKMLAPAQQVVALKFLQREADKDAAAQQEAPGVH